MEIKTIDEIHTLYEGLLARRNLSTINQEISSKIFNSKINKRWVTVNDVFEILNNVGRFSHGFYTRNVPGEKLFLTYSKRIIDVNQYIEKIFKEIKQKCDINDN